MVLVDAAAAIRFGVIDRAGMAALTVFECGETEGAVLFTTWDLFIKRMEEINEAEC